VVAGWPNERRGCKKGSQQTWQNFRILSKQQRFKKENRYALSRDQVEDKGKGYDKDKEHLVFFEAFLIYLTRLHQFRMWCGRNAF
jgi:hypothetical protein